MTVNLIGVPDVQHITIILSNVTSAGGQVLPSAAASTNVLIGYVTADTIVDQSDLNEIRQEIVLTADNFRDDLDVNGTITKPDVRIARNNLGHRRRLPLRRDSRPNELGARQRSDYGKGLRFSAIFVAPFSVHQQWCFGG